MLSATDCCMLINQALFLSPLWLDLVEPMADFLLLQYERPDGTLWPIGVLLFEPTTDRLHIRARSDVRLADREDEQILRLYLSQLIDDATSISGSAILEQLESTLSNSIRVSDRTAIYAYDPQAVLDELATRHLR
jgi:hypothetical protein